MTIQRRQWAIDTRAKMDANGQAIADKITDAMRADRAACDPTTPTLKAVRAEVMPELEKMPRWCALAIIDVARELSKDATL